EQGAEEGAGVRALEVRPVPLRFEAEHYAVARPAHVVALPAITDLTTDQTAGGVAAAFADRRNADAGKRVQRPAIARGAATAVDTDVEAGPVVHRRGNDRGGLGVDLRRKVGSEGGSRAQSEQTNGGQEDLLHGCSPIPLTGDFLRRPVFAHAIN